MGVQAEWLVAEPAGTWVRSLLQGPGGRPPQPGGSSPADAPASWVSMRAPAFRVRLPGSEGCSQLIQPPVPLPAWCPNTPSAAGQLSLRLSPSPPASRHGTHLCCPHAQAWLLLAQVFFPRCPLVAASVPIRVLSSLPCLLFQFLEDPEGCLCLCGPQLWGHS